MFVGGDVKHGSAVARHDGVLHFCVLADVQVVGFDPAHHGSQRRRLGDSQVKEACGGESQTSRRRSPRGVQPQNPFDSGSFHVASRCTCGRVAAAYTALLYQRLSLAELNAPITICLDIKAAQPPTQPRRATGVQAAAL